VAVFDVKHGVQSVVIVKSIAMLLVGLLASMDCQATTYMRDDRAARERRDGRAAREKREEDHRQKMKEIRRKDWEDHCKRSHKNMIESSGYKFCIRIGGFEKKP
jgi:hypothetical protein